MVTSSDRMLPLVIFWGMEVKKITFLSLLSLSLIGCASHNPSYQREKQAEKRVEEKENYKILEISSQGDFSGKPINGVQLRKDIAKRSKNGELSGYIVHSVTYAPYNNTWSKKGWFAGTENYKKGSYNLRGYFVIQGGRDGTVKNVIGWHGFTVGNNVTTNHDKYVGSNAFGVTAHVERLRYKGAILVFGNNRINPDSELGVDADIEVIGDLPTTLSMRECKIEYLARVTGLSNSFVIGGRDRSPTLDSPDDIKGDIVAFNAELIAARLVNAKTGEVYPAKLKWVFREI